MRTRRVVSGIASAVLAAAITMVATGGEGATGAAPPAKPPRIAGHFKHVVVIYQENHSFDNLYGAWGDVGGEHVDGTADAPAARTLQVAQDGSTYACLRQTDVNLTSPPLTSICSDPAHGTPASAFSNDPFTIDDHIAPTDTTCPDPPGSSAPNGVLKGNGLPGGCTRDLVHRFYQEQYQLNGGQQNRYVTGSDAVGLTMGTYDTTRLPVYRYLHRKGAPKYVVADRFFQGAFGGSFLNHQWLIAGRAPLDPTAGTPGHTQYSRIDSNGMPTSYPQYVATGPVADNALTVACPDGNPADYAHACGNFAVNTVQPASPPARAGQVSLPLIDDDVYPNIGDRLSDAGISWNWYSGGWDDAAAGNPGALFQYHHQPFNYFADYAPGQPGRAHLQDEKRFFHAARNGTLPTVSFVKPYGAENEHPGYASASDGSSHLVRLLDAVLTGPQAGNTLVIVTYDEFGGQWDHVPPPGQGGTPGAHDAFGPGTRIPALLLARSFTRSGVDHTVLDTTSIIATLERSFGLAPVGIRDTAVNDLTNAVRIGRGGH